MINDNILTISGSDILSGGGAQTDLSVYAHHGLFGFLALTSLTTLEDEQLVLHPVANRLFRQELDSLLKVPFGAIKIGLLPTPGAASNVKRFLKKKVNTPVVLDPVLVFKENKDATVTEMSEKLQELFPYADLVTPNLREAEILTGRTIATVADLIAAAWQLKDMGARQVVIKGGIRLGRNKAIDVYCNGLFCYLIARPVLEKNANGSGCAFSSALAANLAMGRDVYRAVQNAKEYTYQAINASNAYGVNPK
ncbi:bifunctional hydroxymethylpyrimidine kinase/phosphomethylpyrimidine kinase [Streptococcus sp. DD12]|uniref:bifunctional hydroxymethylpyrimidine kinase/phosphomethylpyrimidine kinase n=1 Tax=Streptococcus sp. DD12 TaxID=1777880 RepID=UPI000795050D|nr:bifunctional hydroxymethylpyrimidine kinase/phosphomethylpyrimidine kinase [Streptococcus sp. DD12]KXT75987.1 putative pyridoxal kinase, thiD family [Streptococcus sp. DD12]